MKCSACSVDNPRDKLTGGWKQKGDLVFCPSCWKQLYFVRSVVFPVASVISGPSETKAENWKLFRGALSACWQQSTQLANWAVTEMAKRDAVRIPGMAKLPPAPPNKKTSDGSPSFYLYKQFQSCPLATEVFPELDTGSIVAILNTVQAKYKASRIDVIWRRAAALPTFRYPYPYPVPSQRWKSRWLSDTELAPVIDVKLNGQDFSVRLRSGHGFRRQKKAFELLMSGDASPCELAIYRVRAAQNDNRIGLKTHENGSTVHYNIMIKLVMWLPKEMIKRDPKVLTIATDKESFLVASFGDSELWRINGDQVRRWIAEYNIRRHRLSDELKAELRTGGHDRFADLREKLAKHQSDRLSSFIHESARQVSNYAARHHCSTVCLHEDEKSYFPNFPWDNFRTKMKEKLNEHNITLAISSDRPIEVEAKDESGTYSQE